jgi:hypothetical protein
MAVPVFNLRSEFPSDDARNNQERADNGSKRKKEDQGTYANTDQ